MAPPLAEEAAAASATTAATAASGDYFDNMLAAITEQVEAIRQASEDQATINSLFSYHLGIAPQLAPPLAEEAAAAFATTAATAANGDYVNDRLVLITEQVKAFVQGSEDQAAINPQFFDHLGIAPQFVSPRLPRLIVLPDL
jgi:hypothetical protein